MAKKLKTIDEMKYFDFMLEPGKEDNKRISINSSSPLITVITICKSTNELDYIDQTLKSLKNQTFPFWEWLIVSKEENKNLKDLAKKDKSIVDAKIYAANNATTELLFMLDTTNLLDKTMLECGFFTMKFNDEAQFAYSRTVEFGTKEQLYNVKLSIAEEKKRNIISSGAFIRKDKFLEEYGKLNNENYEDWYMWLNFLAKKYTPLKMGFYGFGIEI